MNKRKTWKQFLKSKNAERKTAANMYYKNQILKIRIVKQDLEVGFKSTADI